MSQVSDVLRIRADVSELAHVRQFIRDRSRLAGANRQTTDDMVQAVDELVTNSIVHGYKGDQGAIEVEVDIRDQSLIVRLRDQGAGLRPNVGSAQGHKHSAEPATGGWHGNPSEPRDDR